MGDAERFWSKVDKSESCWTWVGASSGHGYGKWWHDGRPAYAHRWSYEQAVGPIPPGRVIDHLCRNTICVNPDHLEAVTPGENIARGLEGFELTGRCRSGLHDMTDPTLIYFEANGDRRCRPCRMGAQRTRRRNRSAAA